MNILGIDPGPHALGWCTLYPGGHQFGTLDLREGGALEDLQAKIDWADVVYCESYRPREFLQGEGPKTAEVIGKIETFCAFAATRLVMVDHVTWRTWASQIAAYLALHPKIPAPACRLHLREDGGLKGDHSDEAFWIARRGWTKGGMDVG